MTKYIIQKGDTLTSIAKKFNTTVDELVKINHIKDADVIYAGSTLNIPDDATESPVDYSSIGEKFIKALSAIESLDEVKELVNSL